MIISPITSFAPNVQSCLRRKESILHAPRERIRGDDQREETHIYSKGQVQEYHVQDHLQVGYDRMVHHNLIFRLLAISEAIRIRNAQIYMN